MSKLGNDVLIHAFEYVSNIKDFIACKSVNKEIHHRVNFNKEIHHRVHFNKEIQTKWKEEDLLFLIKQGHMFIIDILEKNLHQPFDTKAVLDCACEYPNCTIFITLYTLLKSCNCLVSKSQFDTLVKRRNQQAVQIIQYLLKNDKNKTYKQHISNLVSDYCTSEENFEFIEFLFQKCGLIKHLKDHVTHLFTKSLCNNQFKIFVYLDQQFKKFSISIDYINTAEYLCQIDCNHKAVQLLLDMRKFVPTQFVMDMTCRQDSHQTLALLLKYLKLYKHVDFAQLFRTACKNASYNALIVLLKSTIFKLNDRAIKETVDSIKHRHFESSMKIIEEHDSVLFLRMAKAYIWNFDRCVDTLSHVKFLLSYKQVNSSIDKNLLFRNACKLGEYDLVEFLLDHPNVDPCDNKNEVIYTLLKNITRENTGNPFIGKRHESQGITSLSLRRYKLINPFIGERFNSLRIASLLLSHHKFQAIFCERSSQRKEAAEFFKNWNQHTERENAIQNEIEHRNSITFRYPFSLSFNGNSFYDIEYSGVYRGKITPIFACDI